MFYGLTHEELEGKRPMAKFLSIKLIVMFTFYQAFVVSQHLVILRGLIMSLLSFSSRQCQERLFMVRSWHLNTCVSGSIGTSWVL